MFRHFRKKEETQKKGSASKDDEFALAHPRAGKVDDEEHEGEEAFGLKLLAAGEDPVVE